MATNPTDAQLLSVDYYKKIVDDAEGQTFWQRQAAEGWDSITAKYTKGQQAGRDAAKSFLASVADRNDPDHDRAMKAFRDEFGLSEDAVYKRYAEMMADVHPRLQHQDASYENRQFSNFRISTTYDHNVISNFKDLMKAKWAAVGYAGDPKVRALYFAKYPLSTGGDPGADPGKPSGMVG